MWKSSVRVRNRALTSRRLFDFAFPVRLQLLSEY